MDAFLTNLGFVFAIGSLFGLAGVVKPFWFMKKRWHGGLVILGCFVAFSIVNTIPLKRPDHISEADWTERVRVCLEGGGLRECPANDTMVAEARAEVTERLEKAAWKAEIKTARARANEAEDLKRAKERELAAAGAAVVETAEKLNDPTQQAYWVSVTESAVRRKMRDPGSVRFRNSRFHLFQDNAPMVCGEVNAKNGFGGATGYKRYIAAGGTFGPVLEEMMSPSEFAKTWNEICT